MQYKDYYNIMGLKRDATQDEIKRAHRKLARKYHPDVSKEANAEAKFKELSEAYEVLKDPQKRTAYDRIDPNVKSGQGFHPPPNWNSDFEFRGGDSAGPGGADFSDFFEELFGQPAHRSTHGRQVNASGQDQHAKIMIDLDDAFHGATRSINLQSPKQNERGQVHVVTRTLKVKIPKGIKEGQKIRLKGQGLAGMGQEAKGDLYLEIQFKPHPIYRVEDRDLHMPLPVTPWEAALGATVKIPTPNGAIDLKIPANSNSGNKLRLKGCGIPGDPTGDIYTTLTIVTPPSDNEQAKALYEEMAKTITFNPRANMGA